jgi:hypothetical protein
MSPIFKDFSGRHVLEVAEIASPDSLSALCAAVRRAEANGWSVHAMGSAWAFSAPAYCPGMVIATDLLRGFPAGVQRAINDPDSGGKVLVAVEAGIKIRDLCLALAASPRPVPTLPALSVTVAPELQTLGQRGRVQVTVQSAGGPVEGALVTVQNFDGRRYAFSTTADGVASFLIAFTPRVEIDPVTHERDVVELPSGTVEAEGFGTATLPLFFEGWETPPPPPIPTPIEADRDEAPWVPPWELGHGRDLWPPTLGGAGGQSIAGAVSTGTHGADVARPPIGDYMHAMVLVGSGGVVRLLQRDGNPPVVDFGRLRSNLSNAVDPSTVLDATGTQAFDAAVVSAGRFGVVYAYVMEVHDESENFLYSHRSTSSWEAVKGTLLDDIERARQGDEFLQVAINPVRPRSGDRACYVTRQKKLPRSRVPNAGQAFLPPAPVASTELATERARAPTPDELLRFLTFVPAQWLALAGAMIVLELINEHFHHGERSLPGVASLCADRLTPGLVDLQDRLRDVAVRAALMNIHGKEMFAVAAESIGNIGPDYKLGDVVAAALKAGPLDIVDGILSGVIESAQRPWLVHGTRYQISDNFDYENDCYRGDSVEIFFAADAELPRKVELVIDVFDDLHAQNIPLLAWISLRFMAPSTSLLGMAAFSPVTCAIEVSMLRGGLGNDRALRWIQEIATNNDGRTHWGQQNNLTGRQVAVLYGDRYPRWCQSLQRIEGGSPTFSNPFSQSHGLEPVPPRPLGTLDVSVSPSIISFGASVTITVGAADAARGAEVAGVVTIANFAAGLPEISEQPTNTPFAMTFEAGPAEFDFRGHPTSGEDPSGTVAADGYEPASVPFRFR